MYLLLPAAMATIHLLIFIKGLMKSLHKTYLIRLERGIMELIRRRNLFLFGEWSIGSLSGERVEANLFLS